MYTAKQLKEKLEASSKSLETDVVPCPEIEDGFEFRIKELDGDRIDFWQRIAEELGDDPSKSAKYGSLSRLVVALSAVDAGDDYVFEPHDFASHGVLGRIPGYVRDRIALRAYSLSKMTNDSRAEMAKNSPETPDVDS